jgi:hypothetical protein
MNVLENQTYLMAYMVANAIALFLLFASGKWPRLARSLFVLLFAGASYTNWWVLATSPKDYLAYANMSFLLLYKDFIHGWFSTHIQLVVGFIATIQALIALSLLMKGWIYKTGCLAAILFFLLLSPLGVGAAFPCTLILAIATWILLKNQHAYLWQYERRITAPGID